MGGDLEDEDGHWHHEYGERGHSYGEAFFSCQHNVVDEHSPDGRCQALCSCFDGEGREHCRNDVLFGAVSLVSSCVGLCMAAALLYAASSATGMLRDLGLCASMGGNSGANSTGNVFGHST